MTRPCLIIVVILFCAALWQCTPHDRYEKEAALIDSLKIVLRVKLSEVNKAEAAISASSFGRFDIYRRFLSSNTPDTIEKAQASAIRNFVSCGKVVSDFANKSPQLAKETETSISQLQALASDLRAGHAQNLKHVKTESDHAQKLIAVLENDLRLVNGSLINFRNSIAGTEAFIRQINHGRLPSLVTDTTSNGY